MLSKKLIADVAQFIEGQVVKAEAIIGGEAFEIPIMKTEIDRDILKIYTNTSEQDGLITDIQIKNKAGEVIISKATSIQKDASYSVVSSFYIRITEEEVDKPLNIFEQGGKE